MTEESLAKTEAARRWGMVVDLNRCVGCQTCTVACKHANDTSPGVQWRRVLDVEQGQFPDVERLFLVVGCQHCANPPCVPVCPTGATRQQADGLVTMSYDLCIGCAYCAVACPYQARTIVHETRGYFGRELTAQERATAHPERTGVAQKCTFCQDRVDNGLAAGLVPGVDPDATPACAASCIAGAIHFGDFNAPHSNVSRLIREHETVQMHAELGTDPQIKYLYTTPAIPGRDAEGQATGEEDRSDLSSPLVGPLQRFWDWRAAMNWCFGGLGSGLVIVAWAATAVGMIAPSRLPALSGAGAALIALGLFFVFMKIGRRARFWRAVMRPTTSWMTRELYAAVVFYAAAAWLLVSPGIGPATVMALAAVGFLVCQANILYRARGIPAWRQPLIPWMLVASGLLEGSGALAAGIGIAAAVGAPMLAGGAMVWRAAMLVPCALIICSAALWLRYLRSGPLNGVGPLARRALASITPALLAAGYGLPLVLFASAAVIDGAGSLWSAAAAGVAVIFGGAWWKFTVIVRAGYQQGFALPKLPQRGSGRKAAPPLWAGTAAR